MLLNPVLRHENFKPHLPRAWDPRGITGKLRYLANEEGPEVLVLSETRRDMDGFVRLKKKLGLNKGFAVSRIGLGGGLVMLLCDNVDIDVQNSSPYYI